MTKKEIILTIIMFVLVFSMLALLIFFLVNKKTSTPLPDASKNPVTLTSSTITKADIPTKGNDTILLTKSETKLRIINEYDTSLFTSNKNLLIMFGSWCPHCKEELLEIEKILQHYKNAKDINIIVIAHEYKDGEYPLDPITKLIENDVNFGNIQVLIDFSRIIRKNIDPTANTVPISYVVDKNGNILNKHDDGLTLEKAQEMLK